MTKDTAENNQRRALVLWTLLGLFVFRVFGQLLVAFGLAPFLPPMPEWFSGAIPYHWLLVYQTIIIFLFAKVCTDFSQGQGFFVLPHRKMGVGLLFVGTIYLSIMVIRYGIRMSLYPHERWAGGSIPIFFHWVLASFLLIVGSYHWKRTRNQKSGQTTAKRWLIRIFWLIGWLLAIAGIALWIKLQLAPANLAKQLGIGKPEYAVRVERGVKVLMSDGVALVSDVYHPLRIIQAPTILVRIPLFKAMKPKLFATVIGRMWAEHGYTVVIQGIRGHYGSGGVYYPLRSERDDGIKTLEWIAKQSWFNGRLGMWGGSYFGYTQWVLADQTNPGPSVLMIQLCSTDFHKMFYPGGAFSLESALYWATWSASGKPEALSSEVLDRGYKDFPLIESDDRVGKDINYFNDWVTHSEKDNYWKEIDGEGRTESLQAPVMLMAGWYDPFLPTQLDDFISIKQHATPKVASASRLVIGPWSHARNVIFPGGLTTRNYRLETIAPSVTWFNRHLKDSPAADGEAAVKIFVMGKNEWRDEQEWPLARTKYTPYYLSSAGQANGSTGNGELVLTPPTSKKSFDRYSYDPKNPVPSVGGAMMGPRAGIVLQDTVEKRQDVLVYTTLALTEDIEITGPVVATLFVSTTAPSTDFTAKLVDVHPNGDAYNVTEGILRKNYQGMSQSEEIKIELWPTSMVFLKGHRIRLEVSSSNYPRFDRNPNIGRMISTETKTMVAEQTIYHSDNASSHILLPIIPDQQGG